jgi:hypothetical protein
MMAECFYIAITIVLLPMIVAGVVAVFKKDDDIKR